jgi:ubiquinone/menaquinone biosynthesis C-methylase UbiE
MTARNSPLKYIKKLIPTPVKGVLKTLLGKSPGKESVDPKQELRRQISNNPESAELYYQLGKEYFNSHNFFTSTALFRTALTFEKKNLNQKIILALAKSYQNLGLFDLALHHFNEIKDYFKEEAAAGLNSCLDQGNKIKANNWALTYLGYGKYQRFKVIIDSIKSFARPGLKIMDMGGGNGEFSLFVPQHHYALVEPLITGIGTPIPFKEKYFDIAVCADVIEHIPKNRRESSILEIMRLARKRVYLTAPFGKMSRESETLFFKITKNRWTGEHLSHEFSTLEEIENFLKNQGVQYKVSSLSFLPTHLSISLLNNYYLKDNKPLFEEFNHFFNSHYSDLNIKEPSYGHLFEIILS